MSESSKRSQSRLSPAESESVVAQLVDAQAAGLPLATGLRAASQEFYGAGTRRSVSELVARLEAGQSLGDALDAGARGLPSNLTVLLRIAALNPQAAALLPDLVSHWRQHAALRRELRASFWYPLTLFAAALFVTVAVPSLITRDMVQMLREMNLKLTGSLLVLEWVGTWGLLFFGFLGVALLVTLAAMRIFLGAGRFRSAFYNVPLVGSVWRWLDIARWAQSLQLFLEGSLALPEALAASADGMHDEVLANSVRAAAEQVRMGGALADSLAECTLWPEGVLAYLRWGEKQQVLLAALGGIAESCEERARQRSRWFRAAFPSVIFLLIAQCVAYTYVSIMYPLVNLISSLS